MQDIRLRDSLGYALVRLFRQVNRETGRALAPYRLSAEQAHILLLLWFEGPLKVGELQRLLTLSSGTLTGAVDRMEAAGLVVRVADPRDRRAWRIEPARFDPRRRSAIVRTLEEMEARSFGSLTAAERRELLRLLRKAAHDGADERGDAEGAGGGRPSTSRTRPAAPRAPRGASASRRGARRRSADPNA
jgi:DNA-binding MarR family transcriptional regulator